MGNITQRRAELITHGAALTTALMQITHLILLNWRGYPACLIDRHWRRCTLTTTGGSRD